MATLLHFLRSLAVTLLTGFLLSLCTVCIIGLLLGCLMALNVSPMSAVSAPLYAQVSQFLAVFGRGDRLEGTLAIALTIGVVAALLGGFGSYKRSQRSQWHLAVSNALKE
jgi:hypothetical protein